MSIDSYAGANIALTDTMAAWLSSHNQVIFDLSQHVLTAANVTESNTSNGSRVSGNTHVDGVFAANTVVAFDQIRGGRNAQFGNSAVLTVTSNVVIGNSTVGDTLTVAGDSTFSANVTLGSNSSDVVQLLSTVNTSVIPTANLSYDLGNTTQQWANLYVGDIVASGSFVLSANTPTFTLIDTDSDSSAGPIVDIQRDSPNSANNDDIGIVRWTGNDSGGASHTYAEVSSSIEDNTNAGEDGALAVKASYSGALTEFISINPAGAGTVVVNHKGSGVLVTTDTGILITGEVTANTANVIGDTAVGGNVVATGGISTTSTTDASNTSTGALTVAGGVGIEKKLFVGANADFANDVIIQGDLSVTGTLTATGSFDFSVNASSSNTSTVSSLLVVNGNTDFGNATTDTVSFVARVDTDVVPSANDTYDLGTTALVWAQGHFANVYANQFIGTNANVATVDASANISTPLVVVENQGAVRFVEPTANGTNFVAVRAPDQLAANVTLTLPNSDGDANQYLKTDGGGNLSWATVSSTLEIDGDTGTANVDLTSEQLAIVGGTGVDTTLSSNATHTIVTVNVGQAISSSDSPSFAGATLTGVTNFQANAAFGTNEAIFGAATDLRIRHVTGSDKSFITHAGSGLDLQANTLNLTTTSGQLMMTGAAAGAVTLYFANSVKMFTKTDGIDVVGEVQADSLDIDGAADISGTLTARDLVLSGNLTVNGTTTTVDTTNLAVSDSLIELNSGVGSNANDLGIVMERGSTGDNAIIAWDESADKFIVGTTTATGASTGDLSITKGILVADIEGDLNGTANQVSVAATVDSTAFVGLFDSATGNQQAKSSSGFTYNAATNTATVDSLVLNTGLSISANTPIASITDTNPTASDGPILELHRNSPSPADNDLLGSIHFYGEDDADAKVLYGQINSKIVDATAASTDGTIGLLTFVSGSQRTMLNLNDSGSGAVDLFFANTTGSAVKLTTKSDGIDVTGEVQADSLDIDGVADIAGVVSLHANVGLDDNNRIILGTGSDLQVFHDGSHSHILDNGSGNLKISTSQLDILGGADGAETMATFVDNGAVSLYHDNSKKIETTAGGVNVTGTANVSSDLNVVGDVTVTGNVDATGFTGDGSALTGMSPFTVVESSEIAVANGYQNYAVSHGLGYKPKQVWPVLVCKTTNLGYAVDDEVNFPPAAILSFGGGLQAGATWGANTTSVFLNQIQNIQIVAANGSSTVSQTINFANWKLKFYYVT